MTHMQVTLPTPRPSHGNWLLLGPSKEPLSREDYRNVVLANPNLRIERTAEGELVIMAPAHSRTGLQNAELTTQLRLWAKRNADGVAFDSSAGFDLPNGANRSPDACWVLKSRLKALSKKEKEEYFPLCPDFVVELRSKSDQIATLQAKMDEYLENGARLGWLVDPIKRRVFVYRPDKPVECLDEPRSVSADPELPGFTLDLEPIWNPEI